MRSGLLYDERDGCMVQRVSRGAPHGEVTVRWRLTTAQTPCGGVDVVLRMRGATGVRGGAHARRAAVRLMVGER